MNVLELQLLYVISRLPGPLQPPSIPPSPAEESSAPAAALVAVEPEREIVRQ